MTASVATDELLTRYITSSRWFRKQDQTVKQDAFIPPDNPNHANIVNWPVEKNERKMRALELAKAARFVPSPGAE